MKDKIQELSRILLQIQKSKDINIIKLLVKRAQNIISDEECILD